MRQFPGHFLAEMTSIEVQEAFRRTDTALITTGSTEQHGRHAALGLDYLTAWRVTQLVAAEVDCIVAPPLPIGYSRQWMDFPGTLTLRKETFAAMAEDVVLSMIWQGANRVVIINGHGRNTAILSDVCQQVHHTTGALITSIDWWKVLAPFLSTIPFHNPAEELPASHGGEVETSTLMAAAEAWELDLVRVAEFARPELIAHPFPGISEFRSTGAASTIAYDRFGSYTPAIALDIRQISRGGVMGNPVGSSAETGRRILDLVTDRISGYVRTIQQVPIEVPTRPRFF